MFCYKHFVVVFFSYSSADKGENVLFRLLFASLQRYFVAKVSEM